MILTSTTLPLQAKVNITSQDSWFKELGIQAIRGVEAAQREEKESLQPL